MHHYSRHHQYPERKSIRLKGYDYSLPGFYFVTICTYQMQHLFGSVREGNMHLNEQGEIVNQEWCRTELIRDNVTLHEFIVMPNHIHGIIEIRNVDIESNSKDEASKISLDPGQDSLDPKQNLLDPEQDLLDPEQNQNLPDPKQNLPDPVRAYRDTPVLDQYLSLPDRYQSSDHPIKKKIDFRSPSNNLGAIIRGFKGSASKQINTMRKSKGAHVWHRNYYERIIRNEKEFCRISSYIRDNPLRWNE
jgi:REP element-mobilizing transposase RayT